MRENEEAEPLSKKRLPRQSRASKENKKAYPLRNCYKFRALRLKFREPGELYRFDITYPSGLSNPSSNCYVNSILQCMINHPSFSEITGGLLAAHPRHCSKKCGCTGGTCIVVPWYLQIAKLNHACIQNRSDMLCCCNRGHLQEL